MSSIRKLKRIKVLHKERKSSTNLLLGEIILYIGIATLVFGAFYAIYNHIVYTSGRSEYTIETRGGPFYHPEEASGNPGRKDSAVAGWKIAGIGLVLIVLSMFISIIVELLQDTINRLKRKAG